jgi:outer membrane protein OmpA-like peptidoglycan-associated protein
MANMKNQTIRQFAVILGCACLLTATATAVENPTKAIPSGEKEKISGIIQGRNGDNMRVRTEDNSVVVVGLTETTKVELKKGLFHLSKKSMDASSLVPGLRVEASGKGNDQGQLVADKVTFDPFAYRASRSLDTRVSPLESRAGALEGRAGQLEGRAGQLETKAGELETKTGQLTDQQKQDEQQTAQVRTEADNANKGVDTVNSRVNSLDDYTEKGKATIYFKLGSAQLSADAKNDLDALVQKTKDMKGYMIQVAGFTDATGSAAVNEALSERRADAVVRYLQMEDVPLRRILAPAGLGESHSVADNKSREGRKLNRRVEVTIIVNKAIESPTSAMNQPSNQQGTQPPATSQPVR